jgi:hypothetical protein
MEAGLQKRFRFVTQLLPKPFDAEFASALARANFSIIITCDSFADTVLKRNHMSYREADILATLKLCEDNGIPSTFSMIFGLPGETVDTLDHTLEQMNRHPPGPLRHYEYTIGGRVYQGTSLCGQVERGRREHLYGSLSPGYMEPLYYVSPDSPAALLQYIEGATGHSLVYGNCSDDTRFRSLALGYLADQGQWQTVVSRFCQSQLPVRSSIYSYVFQKLADSGQVEGAKAISHNLLQAIEAEKEPGPYQDQTSLIRFFLSRLT